jgi:hypothetical protein
MSVSVTNTDAALQGNTLLIAESSQTVTGLKTFDRDPNAPFAVSAGSAVVANLDADKVDGNEASTFVPTVGTWTPALGGATSESGQAYSTQTGIYVKYGDKMVFVWGQITLSTLGTITGQAQIEGLPFTSGSSNARGGLNFHYWSGLTTNTIVNLMGLITGNAAVAPLYYRTNGTATQVSALLQADLSNTTDIVFSGFYRIA